MLEQSSVCVHHGGLSCAASSESEEKGDLETVTEIRCLRLLHLLSQECHVASCYGNQDIYMYLYKHKEDSMQVSTWTFPSLILWPHTKSKGA